MVLLDHLLHSCSPHTGTSLSQEPGLENLGTAGGFQPLSESICGQGQRTKAKGQKGCGVIVDPTSEESDCRNTVRSKFLFVELQWSPPSPLGKAEDTAPTQG